MTVVDAVRVLHRDAVAGLVVRGQHQRADAVGGLGAPVEPVVRMRLRVAGAVGLGLPVADAVVGRGVALAEGVGRLREAVQLVVDVGGGVAVGFRLAGEVAHQVVGEDQVARARGGRQVARPLHPARHAPEWWPGMNRNGGPASPEYAIGRVVMARSAGYNCGDGME